MRKLKITVAVLVVLFACQAVFAGFVPVQKADPAVTGQLAKYCDILQGYGLKQKDPVAFYLEMAASSDEAIGKIISTIGPGYQSVTTLDELALVFPRGVEATSEANAFRRAAVHLAAYIANNGHMHGYATIKEAETSFQIVGYKYVLRLAEGKIKFDFIDIYSDAELRDIAAKLAEVLPGAGEISFPEYGEIDIATTGITEFGFRLFAAYARNLMYSLIY